MKNDRAAWLKGPHVACSQMPATAKRAWRLVLLGAPGVGKGTQAELLGAKVGACHLSTGDVFRATKSLRLCDCSPAMSVALECMMMGELVPDDTVVAMVRERRACMSCGGGFLLDGFPRTVAQAEELEKLLISEGVHLDAVLNYELPLDEVVARLSGRRTCSNCKAVFHVTGRPPKVDGICDSCGGRLVQRDDDREEAVRVRMAAYTRCTAPLIDFYKTRGVLITVNARGTAEEVLSQTLRQLGSV